MTNRWVRAWLAGTALYILGFVWEFNDGLPDLILMPFVAALIGALSVLVVSVFGLLLRLPGIRGFWDGNPRIPGGLLLVGGLALGISAIPGLAIRRIDPGSGMEFLGLNPAFGIPGYFAVLFAIAHAPAPAAARARAVEGRR